MISDVLHDALIEIRDYRTNKATADCYSHPDMVQALDDVVVAMEALRQRLDAFPDVEDSDKTGDYS